MMRLVDGKSIGRFMLQAALLLGGVVPAAADADLRGIADSRLPWRAETVSLDAGNLVLDGGWGGPRLVADDGTRTLQFTARNPGITLSRISAGRSVVIWQHNLAPTYCHRTPCATLAGLWDCDGDGDRDLVVVAVAADRSHWLITALDTAGGEAVARVTVAAGPDHRADGAWDGTMAVLAVADVPTPAGPRRAFLVVSEAGFDLEPRGVMAVDVVTGERLWTHFTGVKPAIGQAAAADLDGDGRPELVYLGAAVDNLHGRPVNGLSDDVCTIVAVDTDGSRLWTRTFADALTGYLQVAAAAGGDGADVVLALSSREGIDHVLQVLDGPTGWTRGSAAIGGVPRGLQCAAAAGGLDLYVGADNVGIEKFHWNGHLARTSVARTGERVFVGLVADLLPPDGAEVMAGADDGRIYVLDADLRPLACYDDLRLNYRPAGFTVWPEPRDRPVLLAAGGPHFPGVQIRLLPNPRPIPWGALVLLPVSGGATWYVRRRRRGASAATRRELRLQLLGRLELSNHGAIGALRSLRRLVWILDARAQAAGDAADLDGRLRDLAGECRDHMLPDLAGILELAVLAGCDAAVTGQARAAHDRIARLVDDGDRAGREQELRSSATLLEDAMMTLRREMEDEFRADLAAAVARVLAAHAEAAAGAGIAVETVGLEKAVWCRIDGEELVFVVDNLVENALRAMASSPQRRLTLTALHADGQVLLLVADTGCGIAPDDWETVLGTRKSSREGGGLGLPESRRRLRKYGGSLAIRSSEAGAGTTLVLSVAPAPARQGEAGSP